MTCSTAFASRSDSFYTVRHDTLNADHASLYSQRPTWLDNAHRRLDEAAFAACGWPVDLRDDEILARLLELNLKRAEK